ncbi:autocrine proliferation repressor protein A-like isoform X5 [Eublepharis macularius]|uniref:Autocrine proliferation repressor protein A-like isoform X5 n=1 Tax=Eublepharis macularius TaxID=481883 RepID=A0AA97KT12_EUBMA|nr:autocrine proliferation repressor protein A-like isoform X5 [Eublepharis macularius]
MERGLTRSWDMHPLTVFLLPACLSSVWLMEWKALDEYVNLPDSHYEYNLLSKKRENLLFLEATFHTIKMSSQKWLDESEVDKPIWRHELTIVVPRHGVTNNESCLLIITPAKNDGSASSNLSSKDHLIYLADRSRSMVAVLRQVPFQPLTFHKHPLGRKKIKGLDIFAYSWWRFMNDPDAPPHWLVQFPMVKATVRAMDTITDYMMKTMKKNITRFILTGISMDGWITWLTAAVDTRVVAIIPIGMDFLNLTESFPHQYRAYCGWSYRLRAFYEMNITQELDHPRFSLLASHLDPLAYNERFTNVSKFIILASGDEVSMPDNSHYYFPYLEGEKHLHIIPNADYRFQGSSTLSKPIRVFYWRVKNNYPHPSVSWHRTMTNSTGIIYFNSSPEPNEIFSYHADTVGGTRQDFRMRTGAGNSFQNNNVKWTKTNVEHVKSRQYKKELEIPAEGWRGFFIQATFPGDGSGVKLVLTSEIHIIPDTFPCPNCNGCQGTLV